MKSFITSGSGLLIGKFCCKEIFDSKCIKMKKTALQP